MSFYLKNEFNIKATKSKIYEIRKRYFIPNKTNRTKNIYLEYEKNYTFSFNLNHDNIKKFKNITAVYELVGNEEYHYNYKSTRTVYVGSTNNLKRRLTQYLADFGHTDKIRNFISNNEVYFRFIQTENYRDLEKDILEAFYITCGNYPVLNSNRVL